MHIETEREKPLVWFGIDAVMKNYHNDDFITLTLSKTLK